MRIIGITDLIDIIYDADTNAIEVCQLGKPLASGWWNGDRTVWMSGKLRPETIADVNFAMRIEVQP